jgi:hypothetical protein
MMPPWIAFFQVNQPMQALSRRNRDSAAGARQRSSALELAGDQNDRQPDEQQRDGAVEHPVGKSELMDQEVNETQHTHRGGPKQQRDSHRVTLSNRLLGARSK